MISISLMEEEQHGTIHESVFRPHHIAAKESYTYYSTLK
jgi:hypothetical protein